MTAAESATFPHITRDPDVVGGEPVIKGTRVPVRSIAIHARVYHDIDQIRKAFPRVSREAIHEAMVYYGLHWQEIEQYIAENEDDE